MLIALFVAVALAQPAPCQSTQGAADVESLARSVAAAIVAKDLRALDVLAVDACAHGDAQLRFGVEVAEDLAKVTQGNKLARELDKAAARVVKHSLAPLGELVFLDPDPTSVKEGDDRSFDAFFQTGFAWRKVIFVATRIGARWYLADDDLGVHDVTEKASREYWHALFERLIVALEGAVDPGAEIDRWWSKYRATLVEIAPDIRRLTDHHHRRNAREPFLWVLRVLGEKAAAHEKRLQPIAALYGEPISLAKPVDQVLCDAFYTSFMKCMSQSTDLRHYHTMIMSMLDDCGALHLPPAGQCPGEPAPSLP